ncbi:MAG TPA: DUF5666 domain-containing protein [Pseudonocardiaceae bacterium]
MRSLVVDRLARRFLRPGLVLATGALAVAVVAACGGGATPTTAPAPATTKAPSSSRANQPPPGTFGTVASVAASSLEVQNQTGQVTVNFSSSTTFTNTISATLADVAVGSCVAATSPTGSGAQPATLTAQTVLITPATANGCTVGGFGGGGGGGFAGRPSGAPRPSNRPRPSGANGAPANGARAFGSVTAVSATGFTVHSLARGTTPARDTAVTVSSTTTYTKTVSATSSALAVGQCIAAIGPADDTGAITARSIAISKPGPNGCTARFVGGRGGLGAGNGQNGAGGGNG